MSGKYFLKSVCAATAVSYTHLDVYKRQGFADKFIIFAKITHALMSHRILLIDDEDDILEFIRYNLTKAGYEVYTARNGAEGLQQAAAHRPHLILLDVMMPTMDGIETCRALRCDPALKETMVVFLSALGEEEQQLAGFGAGADDYISKPIKPKLLISRIQAILKRVAADKPASLVIDRERHLVIRNGCLLYTSSVVATCLRMAYLFGPK